MKKQGSYRPILGILLLIYIGSMMIINKVTSDKVFSEAENRRLEQAPKLSTSQLMDGRFTANYEKYVSDQFPLRDFWIGVKSNSEKALGKKENNGVYLGKDGYLMEKFEKPSEKIFKSKVDDINALVSNMENVNKYFILVPNSVKILEDKLPAHAPNADELVYIDKVKSSLDDNIRFIDVYEALYSNRDEYIYYKTDHHWTTKGAYLAYEKFMEDMGMSPHKEDYFDIKKVTDSFYGSLYSKSGFRGLSSDSIKLYMSREDEDIEVEYIDEGKSSSFIYNMDNLRRKDKYKVFLDGNHPLIRINTNADSEEKLLIVKDSYANSFIPFLTEHFSQIHVVDPRYYDEDIYTLIQDHDINNLLIIYNVKTFFD